MNRYDELDDPFIARYAERVDDEVEVLWRADFARVLDYEDRGYEEDATLLLRAREIRDRWAADPQVAARWNELDEIHAAWIFAPEAMRRAHEVTMPGGLRPPGMDDTRWASHMQAREMADQGAWPGFEPTYSISEPERHEPMTDTTDHTSDIDEFTTESDAEQLMRSDFTHWAAVSDGRDPSDYDPADDLDRDEYASTWLNHADDRWAGEWLTLSEAHLQYQDNPTEADIKRAMLGDSLGPVEARSWDQARDMAVNGISRDEYGLPNSPYVTRLSYERVAEIRSQQRSLADVRREAGQDWISEDPALSDEAMGWDPSHGAQISSDAFHYNAATCTPLSFGAAASGNALADALARQSEREGAER